MLIYPLRPKSTPSDLSTRGSAIASVSTNLTEHHLTQLPAHSTGSSAAEPHYLGCQRPCCASCLSIPIAKLNENRAQDSPCWIVVGLTVEQTQVARSNHAFPGAGQLT
ncbi:hypothetical protein ACSBR1_039733 [Camellia fascicularis]